MSRFWWKKKHSIINKIKTYLEKIDETRDCFLSTMKALIFEGPKARMADWVENVHQCEHRCDEIQRDIVLQLYKKALIPESRGDVLGLLEATDKIPNTFESLCWQLFLQKIVIPPEFRDRFIHLIHANVEAYNLLRDAILGLFFNRDVQENIQLIYETESTSDVLERNLIRDIYDTDLDLAEKNLLKDTVINIGNISDLAEATNDRLILTIIKRRI
jgi:predicted phosphate transport protein (TIGR00153 family)